MQALLTQSWDQFATDNIEFVQESSIGLLLAKYIESRSVACGGDMKALPKEQFVKEESLCQGTS